MLLNWDSSLLIAVGASFMVGLLGYIIARMWIKPIVGYQLTRRKLARELTRFLEQIESVEQAGASGPGPQARSYLKEARRHAMNLDARYNADLPAWYRLLLASRNQSPERVLALLAPLSRSKNDQQIAARVNEVRKTMGFA